MPNKKVISEPVEVIEDYQEYEEYEDENEQYTPPSKPKVPRNRKASSKPCKPVSAEVQAQRLANLEKARQARAKRKHIAEAKRADKQLNAELDEQELLMMNQKTEARIHALNKQKKQQTESAQIETTNRAPAKKKPVVPQNPYLDRINTMHQLFFGEPRAR